MLWQVWEIAKTKISASLSHITGPAKLNEMVVVTALTTLSFQIKALLL